MTPPFIVFVFFTIFFFFFIIIIIIFYFLRKVELEETSFAHGRAKACVQPAFAVEHLACRIGVLPVTTHHAGPVVVVNLFC